MILGERELVRDLCLTDEALTSDIKKYKAIVGRLAPVVREIVVVNPVTFFGLNTEEEGAQWVGAELPDRLPPNVDYRNRYSVLGREAIHALREIGSDEEADKWEERFIKDAEGRYPDVDASANPSFLANVSLIRIDGEWVEEKQ